MTAAAVMSTVTCKVASGAVPFVADTMKSNFPAAVAFPDKIGASVSGSSVNVIPGGSCARSTTPTAGVVSQWL